VGYRVLNERREVRDFELLHEPQPVGLRCPRREPEVLANLGIRFPVAKERNDALLDNGEFRLFDLTSPQAQATCQPREPRVKQA